MALEQKIVIDKIEVMENGVIQVRQRTDIFDSKSPSVIIAFNYYRWTLTPAQDLTDQAPNVVAVANAIWTADLKNAYQTQNTVN
jgi:hypothetical protein